MSFDEQPDGDPHGECAAEIHSLQERLAAAEARAERLAKSLKEIIDDLETRSDWKEGTQKGVVDIGQGVYLRGKAALAEGGPRWADGGDAMAGAMAGM